MVYHCKCSINLFILLFMTVAMNYAQERYVDSVFSKISKVTYTYSDTLKIDFYSSKDDTLENRPLLVLVHGGGFGSGKRDNPLESRFSEDMAKRGYAVASMSYRLTRKGKSFSCNCPSDEKIQTFLAVSEDVLKAIQYLVDRSDNLGFDTAKIVLIGSSAGAEAVLNTAFLQYHRDFRKLPYGDLKFAGVVSFAGAVLNADYITKKNTLRTLLFHGKKDNLVPFATAAHHYCDDTAIGFLMLDGSMTVADRLEILDTSYTLAYDPDGNHDWANLPYSNTELISKFIKETIIDGEHRQSKIKLSAKN